MLSSTHGTIESSNAAENALAPVFIATTEATILTNLEEVSLPKPAGTIEGDLIVMFLYLDGTVGTPTAVGFTTGAQVTTSSPGACNITMLFKIAGPAEGPTYTINWTNVEQGNAHAATFRYTSLEGIASVTTTGDSATPDSATRPVAEDNNLILCAFVQDVGQTPIITATPNNMISGNIINGNVSSNSAIGGFAYITDRPAGSFNPLPWTIDRSNKWATIAAEFGN